MSCLCHPPDIDGRPTRGLTRRQWLSNGLSNGLGAAGVLGSTHALAAQAPRAVPTPVPAVPAMPFVIEAGWALTTAAASDQLVLVRELDREGWFR